MKLTMFEKKLKAAYERGDFVEVSVSKKKRAELREAAIQALAKSKSITLRINTGDLEALKDIAAAAGKKYQTYIGELLHEHVRRKKAA